MIIACASRRGVKVGHSCKGPAPTGVQSLSHGGKVSFVGGEDSILPIDVTSMGGRWLASRS